LIIILFITVITGISIFRSYA